jgi:ATP-dependent exoDNAse (exonuclease V) beta subunit
VHWLLERLAPPDAIEDPALLKRLACTDDAAFDDDLLAARAILDAPALRPFLDPVQYDWARNEVSFATGDGNLRRMDRVVRRGGDLWVLDYKTGEGAAGASAEDVVRAHLDQMREYARAAGALFPGLSIRVALVLAGGVLREVPGALLAEVHS